MFLGNSCDSESSKKIQKLEIGDKFTYQSDEMVDIAREDSNVIVYRLWTLTRYHYYSITRKDSIIYRMHSDINK